MIGIPFKLVSQSDESGPVEKIVYLRSRRSGQDGKAFQDAKRKCRGLEWDLLKAQRRYTALEKRVEVAAAAGQDVTELMDQREQALERMHQAMVESNAAMEHLLRMALKPNYGAETDAIMDALKDSDFPVLLDAIETGEVPKDFFAGVGQPGWSTATSASGESPTASSSSEAGAKPTSNEDE